MASAAQISRPTLVRFGPIPNVRRAEQEARVNGRPRLSDKSSPPPTTSCHQILAGLAAAFDRDGCTPCEVRRTREPLSNQRECWPAGIARRRRVLCGCARAKYNAIIIGGRRRPGCHRPQKRIQHARNLRGLSAVSSSSSCVVVAVPVCVCAPICWPVVLCIYPISASALARRYCSA